MAIDPRAGKPPPPEMLIDVALLQRQYYELHPDPTDPDQKVRFGTSGHRGSAATCSFNEDHIAAISQAIAEYRSSALKVAGPLYMGMDTHALSEPARRTAIEVLAANGVSIILPPDSERYTPTPVISHAILTAQPPSCDGIVITPSHNPPEDGGFKYNPPNGGPAAVEVTRWIENRANDLLEQKLRDVRRIPYEQAARDSHVRHEDLIGPYVSDLRNVVDMEAIRSAGIRIGVDPLGGSSVDYWQPIAQSYGLDLTVVNSAIDPRFAFMPVDHDGRIRMDCSSPYAMTNLVGLKDRYDIAFGNDTDADRHGIVTPTGGLMNPNHYLASAVYYLFSSRKSWSSQTMVGKTVVTSSILDRVAGLLERKLMETPVGFKYFTDGLLGGSLGFGGEESAGASFLRMSGRVWTTDKDGLIMGLLAAEITAVTGKDPAALYKSLTDRLGDPLYVRLDRPASEEQRKALGAITPEKIHTDRLAGDPIIACLDRAPGNREKIGGVKVVSENGWFAARPSGTEEIYKIYAESYKGQEHLDRIVREAEAIVAQSLSSVHAMAAG
ncbi:MAG TPA: phosphoglucomutase (alpha-D-glucose-1,6-bisphosphate-dependent) [Chthonomonadales bacterium]|nr:phosphoglucomutase (alpha-D-glucose-1,6-bisphosphate-dependent) [Chthonomonadales bacterium]